MLLVVAVDANVDIAQTIIIQSWQCLSFNISELK